MNENICKGLITLIRSAITGEKLPVPEEFSLQEAYPFIKAHQIANIVYEGAVNCGISNNTPIMQELFRSAYQYLVRSTKQMSAIRKVYEAFDAENIMYMPLKGCNLKRLYPKPELRIMGDADILIRMEQYDRIRQILKEQGYHVIKESNHELVWDNGDLHLELHKRIVADHHETENRYFGDGWQFAKVPNGCCYSMTEEDEFVYLFSHFTTHYREGGIGCRQMIDLWVYLRAHPNIDQARIRSGLEKLRLLAFYENVYHTIDVWFADKEPDDMSNHISRVIFSNGSWGSVEQHVIAKASKNTDDGNVKVRQRERILWTLFPKLPRMIQIYPWLSKVPWLLPVMWMARWCSLLFRERKRVVRWVKSQDAVTEDTVSTYKDAMAYVGLSYKH